MISNFRKRLLDGDLLLGTMVTLTDPSVSEILAQQGFDWLFVDGEHGPIETGQLLGILRAVGDKVACVVRVPNSEEVWIKKALDLGATGIIVPNVNTAKEAAAVVSHARYSPSGSRGVGLARAHGYGAAFQDYLASANEQVTVVVQAEHKDAVANIDSIVAVKGIDAVLLGPYDLSASLGLMGQVEHPQVIEAVNTVIDTCQTNNMAIGYFGVSAAAVEPMVAKGCTLIVAGVDSLLLGNACGKLLDNLKSLRE